MLSYKHLEQRLLTLNFTREWYYMCCFTEKYETVKNLNFTDLLKLPKKYHKNLARFFSENKNINFEKYSFKLWKFIEDATGLDLDEFLKLITIKDRLNELEKDFK